MAKVAPLTLKVATRAGSLSDWQESQHQHARRAAHAVHAEYIERIVVTEAKFELCNREVTDHACHQPMQNAAGMVTNPTPV